MASEVLRIRIRADSGNTAAVFNDISRNILGMTVGAAGARSGMMGLGAALSGAQITGRLAAAMFGAAAYGVYSMGSAMIQAAGAQDQFRVSMTALLKDTAKVDQVTSAVKRFADATSFSNEAVFQVAQNLVAAKVPLNNLIPTLQMLGDVSLGNAEKFSGIATAWYQIIAKGKLTAEEINQIAERGVSVWSILAEETGKSVPELQKLAEAGKLTVDAYMPILQRGLAKNYAGSLKEASNLSTNLLVNITKSITNFAAAIGAGLGDTVNPFLQFLAQAFQRAALYAKALTQSAIWARFTQSLQAAAEALAPIIKGIGVAGFIGLIRVVQILTPLMYFFAAALRGIAFAAVQAMQFLKPLQDTFRRIATQIKALDWQGLWTSIKSQSGDIGTKIKNILTEMLLIAWDGFRKDVVPKIVPTAKGIIEDAWKWLKSDDSFAQAFKLWWLANSANLGPLLKGTLNWGTILGSLIAIADIQAALEEQDFSKLVTGLGVLLATHFGNAKFGPVGAIIGALLAQVILTDGFAAWNYGLSAGDWTPFTRIVIAMLAGAFLLQRGQLGKAIGVALFGPEVLKEIENEMKKGDYTSLGIAFVYLFGEAIIKGAYTVLKEVALTIWEGLLIGLWLAWETVKSWQFWTTVALWLKDLPLRLFFGFIDAFKNNAGPMVLGIMSWASAIFIAVYNGLFDKDWIGLAGIVLIALASGLVAWFTAIPGAIIFAISGFVANLWLVIYQAFKTIPWTQLGKDIHKWLSDSLSALGTELWDDVKLAFSFVTTKVTEFFSAVGVLFEAGKEWAKQIYDGMKQGLDEGWQVITAVFKSWTDDIGLWFDEWFSKVWIIAIRALFAGQQVIDAIGEGFKEAWDNAKIFVQATVDGIILFFSDWATGTGGFIDSIRDFFTQPNAMTSGIEAMWNGAKSLVSSTLDSIIEYFRSWSTGDFAKKLQDFFGADVISNAIKNGLKAAWDSAKSVLSGFVTDAKNAVSSAFSGMTGGGGGGGSGGQTRNQAFYAERNSTNNAGKTDAQINAELDARGFAMGGSFRVGGSGGTDSQLVQFRASPNETVTIRRPDQGGGGMVIQTMNVYADSYQGGQDAARAIRDALGGQRKMLFATT